MSTPNDTPTPPPSRPTIEQLEAILASEEKLSIEILSNGEVRAKRHTPPPSGQPPCDNDHVAPGCKKFPEPSAQCVWEQGEDGCWHTACDHAYEFTCGGPIWNRFACCPYCGKPLAEQPYVEENDE